MIKEIRDITKIDYSNRITIKNPADKKFLSGIKNILMPEYVLDVQVQVIVRKTICVI